MKIYLIVSLIALGLAAGVLLLDLIPIAHRFLGRVHIGQWANADEWRAGVRARLLKQLNKPPAVPVSDNERLTVIDRLAGRYTNKNLQCWQEASLLLGACELSGEPGMSEKINRFLNKKIDCKTGEWRSEHNRPDSAMLAFAILKAATEKAKIKPAMDKTAALLFSLAGNATVPYNPALPDMRFVDTVGMICPFLFLYGLEYGKRDAVELAEKQIREYVEFGLHPVLKLPAHCFDTATLAPLGIYGWGRGCGWLAVGLMDSYLCLSSNSNSFSDGTDLGDTKRFIMEQMVSLAGALLPYQAETGAWCRQVAARDAGDSSATAMLAWFFGKLYDLSGDETYKTAADKAREFLISATRRDGTVDFAQGDTKGIGFYSARLDTMPSALGFTARCIAE